MLSLNNENLFVLSIAILVAQICCFTRCAIQVYAQVLTVVLCCMDFHGCKHTCNVLESKASGYKAGLSISKGKNPCWKVGGMPRVVQIT